MTDRDRILVFNTSFFDVSQTFIHEQVLRLSGWFEIDLLAYKFMNPHKYDTSRYREYRVARYSGWKSRLLHKTVGSNRFDYPSKSLVRQLFRENNYRAVHAHFGTNALDLLPYAREAGVPMVVSFHGADASRTLRSGSYSKRLTSLFDYASAIVISSRHMAVNLNLQQWQHKSHFVPYGIDTDRIKPGVAPALQAMPGTGGRKVHILHSGRLTGKKGVPDLIRVFSDLAAEFPEAVLHIAGDGEERTVCETIAKGGGAENRIVFYGPVAHSRVVEMLQATDIFVLNSRTGADGDMEGTPVSILEAMAAGKSVVSTRHAGIPCIIQDGQNGLLVSEFDNDGLKDAIRRLITDAAMRKHLGEAARCTVIRNYTTQALGERLRRVYQRSGILVDGPAAEISPEVRDLPLSAETV